MFSEIGLESPLITGHESKIAGITRILTEKNNADLTRCAEDILLTREHYFPATIADLYDPDNMPADWARRMRVMTRCWSAFISAVVSETIPSGWKSLFDLYTAR
jgi:hypothetical protein